MAWEEFERSGTRGYYGDSVQDELSLALKAIAVQYKEQYGRKPRLDELLYNLERLLRATPERYVQDAHGLKTARLHVEREEAYVTTRASGLNSYECVYNDKPSPGVYEIVRRTEDGQVSQEVVVRVKTLRVAGRTLLCEYEVTEVALDSATAEQLVLAKVLGEFLFDRFRDRVDEITFINLTSGTSHTTAYPH